MAILGALACWASPLFIQEVFTEGGLRGQAAGQQAQKRGQAPRATHWWMGVVAQEPKGPAREPKGLH